MIAPQNLVALVQLERAGWRPHAIYHSHPDGGATLSADDLRGALGPQQDAPTFPDAHQIVVAISQASWCKGWDVQATAFRWDRARAAYLPSGAAQVLIPAAPGPEPARMLPLPPAPPLVGPA